MKISLIILAAGNSKRFKGNKLLYNYKGKCLYKHTTDKLAKSNLFYEKIIITQYKEILLEERKNSYHTVENLNPSLGISSSVKLGVLSSSPNSEGYMFIVCDQPNLTEETIEGFVKDFIDSGKTIGFVASKGKLGNPSIFLGCHREKLLALHGDKGGKGIIKDMDLSDIFVYEIENPEELCDIDTPEDL